MKLLNKKGFILVETLIVTIFVATLFILVYQNIVPSIGQYEALATYDDIDSVYASNLYKQLLIRYANNDYIDDYLQSRSYLNISDCTNSDIYMNSDYCVALKESLGILEDDFIFLIDYNQLEQFRNEVKTDDFFDSGRLSNFRNYMNTIPDKDSFYDENDSNQTLVGKYRLFITRTIVNADQSTSLRYANLVIYDGKYPRYTMGEEIKFNPGDRERTFYVLKNSSSFEKTVTLILAENMGTNTFFSDSAGAPNLVLSSLKSSTDSWINVTPLTARDTYTINDYTISYNGYRSRLLEPLDLYTILGQTIEEDYFQQKVLFSIPIVDEKLQYLFTNLGETDGYWMANMAFDNPEMAWTVQKNLISPAFINDTNPNPSQFVDPEIRNRYQKFGIRPVIVVEKEKLSR